MNRPKADEVREQYFGKLKPCPFCGGKAEYGVIHSENGEDGPFTDEGGEYIQCANIDCMATTRLIFPVMEDVKPLLAEVWNRRV